MDCKLEFFSYQNNKTNFYVPPHKHNCFELVYYINGNGYTTIEDNKYDYYDNTFSIISPNTIHDEQCYKESNLIYFGFTYNNYPVSLNSKIYNDNSDQTILKIMKRMKQEMFSKHLHYNIKLNLFISDILIELDRLSKKKNKENDYSFTYLFNFINENYYKRIDLQSLANLSGYSYHHFRHLFKEKTGLSPIKYLLQTRLRNSKIMLNNTNLSITKIAINCGFSNVSQFCTLFKENYKLTPSQYRRNLFH